MNSRRAPSSKNPVNQVSLPRERGERNVNSEEQRMIVYEFPDGSNRSLIQAEKKLNAYLESSGNVQNLGIGFAVKQPRQNLVVLGNGQRAIQGSQPQHIADGRDAAFVNRSAQHPNHGNGHNLRNQHSAYGWHYVDDNSLMDCNDNVQGSSFANYRGENDQAEETNLRNVRDQRPKHSKTPYGNYGGGTSSSWNR